MTKDVDNCILCERKSECFKCLTKEELMLFNETKSTVTYKKGETIIKQGTEFTHVISFNQGLAKLNMEIDTGKNLLIGMLKPTEILCGPGMFTDNKHAFSVTALTDSKICLINVNIFKKLIVTNNRFLEKYLASFSNRYLEAINKLVSFSNKQMHGRVAEALLFFADNIHSSDNFVLSLSRQELADFTSLSKESISRIFNDLNKDKIIVSQGKNIQICDRSKLLRLKETS